MTTNNNNNNINNNGATNGNGLSSSLTDKESLTPSPPTTNRSMHDDVKSEPMELVCGSNNNLPMDEHSNDSIGDGDGKYMGMGDGKGSLRYIWKSYTLFHYSYTIPIDNFLEQKKYNIFILSLHLTVQIMTMISTTVYTRIQHRHF